MEKKDVDPRRNIKYFILVVLGMWFLLIFLRKNKESGEFFLFYKPWNIINDILSCLCSTTYTEKTLPPFSFKHLILFTQKCPCCSFVNEVNHFKPSI